MSSNRPSSRSRERRQLTDSQKRMKEEYILTTRRSPNNSTRRSNATSTFVSRHNYSNAKKIKELISNREFLENQIASFEDKLIETNKNINNHNVNINKYKKKIFIRKSKRDEKIKTQQKRLDEQNQILNNINIAKKQYEKSLKATSRKIKNIPKLGGTKKRR